MEMMLLFASREGEVPDDFLSEAPEDVLPEARLQSDLKALEFLIEGTEPIRIPCRLQKAGWVCYGIGDASGDGSGATIHVGTHLRFRYGQWFSALGERSSNYRELFNLVDTLEGLCNDGSLRGCEFSCSQVIW